jgi:NAD(P)-dependent dehydrogenase (short-subunit alcohol dehydrogenase family)
MTHDFGGQHIVIVGGSSGVGLALARQCDASGANLTLMGRDSGKLEVAARTLQRASTRSIDLRDAESLTAAFADLPRADHLVITAGTYETATLATSEPADWRQVLEERLIGPLLIIKSLAPTLTKSIVLFSGTVARRPLPGSTLGSIAIAGVESAVRALALELAPLRVNAVAPGAIDTPMLAGAMGANKETACAAMAARLPARRIGAPDDAADAVLFLMGNPFMTGAVIEIDGGAAVI